MKKVLKAAVLGLVVVGGFSSAAMAFGGKGHHGDRMEKFINWRVEEELEDLDATPAQTQKINAIKDRLLAEGKERHAGNEKARAEAMAQWNQDSPDKARVHALVDERVEDMKAFAHKVADAALEVHAILTPEQRKQMSTKVEERKNHGWH